MGFRVVRRVSRIKTGVDGIYCLLSRALYLVSWLSYRACSSFGNGYVLSQTTYAVQVEWDNGLVPSCCRHCKYRLFGIKYM